MQKQRSGIRLRHLQQKSNQRQRQDSSPYGGRRKIFDNPRPTRDNNDSHQNHAPPTYTRILDDDLVDKYQNSSNSNNTRIAVRNDNDHQQLMQTVRQNAIEIQQKDQTIRRMRIRIQQLQDQNQAFEEQVKRMEMRLNITAKQTELQSENRASHMNFDARRERPESDYRKNGYRNADRAHSRDLSPRSVSYTAVPQLPVTPNENYHQEQHQSSFQPPSFRGDIVQRNYQPPNQNYRQPQRNINMPFSNQNQKKYYRQQERPGFSTLKDNDYDDQLEKQDIVSPLMALHEPKRRSQNQSYQQKRRSPALSTRTLTIDDSRQYRFDEHNMSELSEIHSGLLL